MTKLALTVFLLGCSAGSFIAHADTFSFGTPAANGYPETVKLSVQTSPDGKVRVRAALDEGEAKCSPFRRDLCGKKVVQVDLVGPSSACTIASPTLISCSFNDFSDSSATVTLEDKSTLSLKSMSTQLSVSQLTGLEWKSENSRVAETHEIVDLQVWGNRADGLDPLVQLNTQGYFFRPLITLDPVKGSLF